MQTIATAISFFGNYFSKPILFSNLFSNAHGNNCNTESNECQLNKDWWVQDSNGQACSGVEVSSTATENGCACAPHSDYQCTFTEDQTKTVCFVCDAWDFADKKCTECLTCLHDKCGNITLANEGIVDCFTVNQTKPYTAEVYQQCLAAAPTACRGKDGCMNENEGCLY